MPQPRKYQSNAERQKAYRDRKRRREAEIRVGDEVTDLTTGERLTVRVLAADAAARAAEA